MADWVTELCSVNETESHLSRILVELGVPDEARVVRFRPHLYQLPVRYDSVSIVVNPDISARIVRGRPAGLLGLLVQGVVGDARVTPLLHHLPRRGVSATTVEIHAI